MYVNIHGLDSRIQEESWKENVPRKLQTMLT